MDTDKPSIRYKSRSLREYDKFYCRLNQPTKWSQGDTLIHKDVCPFRLYEYHAVRDDPRFRDEQSVYNTKERKRLMQPNASSISCVYRFYKPAVNVASVAQTHRLATMIADYEPQPCTIV